MIETIRMRLVDTKIDILNPNTLGIVFMESISASRMSNGIISAYTMHIEKKKVALVIGLDN
jgi:hypothetical protein